MQVHPATKSEFFQNFSVAREADFKTDMEWTILPLPRWGGRPLPKFW
jgi:hypothetical protein